MDSDFWCLKGSQPLSHFCFVFVRCHENSDKDYFIPLFHGITSISPAVCSALLNCCDSPRIRLQHFSLDKSRMRGCRGDARYQCDGEEGVSSRGTDITLLHWRRQVRLNLWRSFIICGATTESEASEQQRHCTGMSVFFYHPPLPALFSLCLFLSFSSLRSPVISLSALPTPLFIEQVVQLRLSMKLCVCEPAKQSKSHSSVRHSRYTLPSDKSEATGGFSAAPAVFSSIREWFIVE